MAVVVLPFVAAIALFKIVEPAQYAAGDIRNSIEFRLIVYGAAIVLCLAFLILAALRLGNPSASSTIIPSPHGRETRRFQRHLVGAWVAAGWIGIGLFTVATNVGALRGAGGPSIQGVIWIGLGIALVAGGVAIAVWALRQNRARHRDNGS